MAPEALAIYGAVTGSVGAINTIKTWIQELRQFQREFKLAPETLDALDLSCGASKCSLENWVKMWGLHENVNSHYARDLWGAETSEMILRHLESIRRLQEEVTQLFSPVLGHTSTRKSLSIVMSVAPKARAKLEHITSQMDRVKELSKEAFELKHGRGIGTEDARQTLQAVYSGVFFDKACSSRTLWRKLYESCREAMENWRCDDLKLELDVFRGTLDPATQVGQRMSPLRLKYSILFPSIPLAGLGEFSVEGPIPLEESPKLDAKSLQSACRNALSNLDSGSAFFRLQDEAEWFGASVPHTTQRICPKNNVSQILDLSTILHPLTATIAQKPLHQFPRSERIRFAFKVAECGIFLCGTPWLFDLKATNIRCLRDREARERNRHFLLETKATKAIITDGQLKYFFNQVFAIGKLLAEVGIGKMIAHLPVSPGEAPGRVFQIGKDQITADDAVAMVGRTIGLEYAAPVRACLHPTRTWSEARRLEGEERYHKALEVYYTSVYCPLKSLKERVDREFRDRCNDEWDMDDPS